MIFSLAMIIVAFIGVFFKFKKVPYSKVFLVMYPFVVIFLYNQIYYKYFWQPVSGAGAPMELLLYPFFALPAAIVGFACYYLFTCPSKK